MIQTQHNNSLLPLEVFKAQGENNRDSAGSGGRQVHNSSSTGMSHETRVIASLEVPLTSVYIPIQVWTNSFFKPPDALAAMIWRPERTGWPLNQRPCIHVEILFSPLSRKLDLVALFASTEQSSLPTKKEQEEKGKAQYGKPRRLLDARRPANFEAQH
ncbi:hypothetical protein HZ326_18752 [Fusarium oxysporum f. sp. albedinis]|nr:hypothetical protein HZ326_18752 [Fusarium oxysporum f. sp. albedinis]